MTTPDHATQADDAVEAVEELAGQLDHTDRLITELMDRVDALEAEPAAFQARDDMAGTAGTARRNQGLHWGPR